MIESMDRNIGRILKTLDELALAGNTLVIFAGDNGGTRSARNTPFSNIKGSTFEGGIRVPAMMKWPGVLPAGTISDQVCVTFDFTASIARLAGVTPDPDKPFEGIDIVEHIARHHEDFDRTVYWRKPRGNELWKGVRQGSLKYIGEKDGDDYQEYLFDLSEDLSEQNNLKDSRPKEFARLKRLYEIWEDEVRRNRRGRPE